MHQMEMLSGLMQFITVSPTFFVLYKLKIRPPQTNLTKTLFTNSLTLSRTWQDLWDGSLYIPWHPRYHCCHRILLLYFENKHLLRACICLCKHISCFFFLAVCLHYPLLLSWQLCAMEQGGLIFAKYLYSTAVVVICCAVLCCNSQLRMRRLLTNRIGHWTLCFSSAKILTSASHAGKRVSDPLWQRKCCI